MKFQMSSAALFPPLLLLLTTLVAPTESSGEPHYICLYIGLWMCLVTDKSHYTHVE